jgi:hypothetical protein
MNGTFLIALGAVWDEVQLSPSLTTAAYWTALYGTRWPRNNCRSHSDPLGLAANTSLVTRCGRLDRGRGEPAAEPSYTDD